MRFAVAFRYIIRPRDYNAIRGQVTMTDQERGFRKEHIWLVALYEIEERAEELLVRLNAIGIDTSEATTLRVEIDDRHRATKFMPIPAPLPRAARDAISGALTGAALALLAGLALF